MTTEADRPSTTGFYEIRVQGLLDNHWHTWFEGFTLTLLANGETLIAGPIQDQAALHGILNKIRDLGLPLVSVLCVGRRSEHNDRKRGDEDEDKV